MEIADWCVQPERRRYTDTDAHTYSNGHTDRDGDGNGHAYSNADAEADADTEADAYTSAASYTGAPTVVRSDCRSASLRQIAQLKLRAGWLTAYCNFFSRPQ